MELLAFLMVFPLVVAAALLLVRSEGPRKAIVGGAAAIIALASLALVGVYLGSGRVEFAFSSEALDVACGVIDVGLSAIVLGYAVKHRRPLAAALAVAMVLLAVGFEAVAAHDVEVEHGFYLDSLTLLMVAVIGVVGSGICVYALGYMEDFQKHGPAGADDRRHHFFAIMFLFLSAMYLIVFSDNLAWLLTGWEVTTVCSFLLIGYTRTDEAINNAFRQIVMNMLGGIAFVLALYCCALGLGTLSLREFVEVGGALPAATALPLALLGLAGLTKAAQMPFHTWLLGAMVAPTPTSALLHSSTMVKAGVFLLLKLAPAFAVSLVPSLMLTLVGGVTFLLCSCMAISQSNAKRVLAYSTIANLGLIVACAGVGSPEAVWAGMFLLLFHAVAKSLLFLCVGTAEHHIGSRDIEDMDLLFERMPRLARLMMLGIMCMFVAPFGMLVAKWATLIAFVDAGQAVMILLLAFGSGATFMFWAKWFGKLSGIAARCENVELTVHRSEWIAVGVMAALIVACCAGMPLLSGLVVEPYVESVFGNAAGLSDGNLLMAAILCTFVAVVLFAGIGGLPKGRKVPVYLSGVSADGEARTFQGSLSEPRKATARNLYLSSAFGERLIGPVGSVLCGALIVFVIVISSAPVAGLL